MFKSLRTRLTGVSVFVVTLSLAALTIAVFMVTRMNVMQSLDADIDRLAKTHATELSQWVADKQQITSSIKLAVNKTNPTPYLQAAEQAGLDLAFFVRADKSYAFTRQQPDGFDGTQRDWYKQAEAEGKPGVTPIYTDAATGYLTISFVDPVIEEGKTVAVVGSDMTLASVIEKVTSIQPFDHSFAFLMDGEGNILAHPDEALAMESVASIDSSLDAVTMTQLAEQGGHQMIRVDETDHLLYAAPVAGTPWVLGVSIDRAEATSILSTLLKLAVLIALLCVIVAGITMALFVRFQLARLSQVRDALQNIATGEGDMTRRVTESGDDELTDIAHAFNVFADQVMAMFVRIRSAAATVNDSSTEIAGGSQNLASRTEQQASALAQTAAAMEEIMATVNQNADNTQQANALVHTASNTAKQGGEIVTELVATMNAVNAQAEQVTAIINVIDGIAFQTNILALNAAVEAARAGEEGRGFAVVAAEVRALAQRSAEAAREIKDLIDHSVEATTKGNAQAERAGDVMQNVVDGIQHVTTLMEEINVANHEQTKGVSEINIAITQMDEVTQQNARLVEESAAAGANLQEQAQELTGLVRSFKLDESV